MTAGGECVCNDVVRKVEIEDKCGVTVDDNVGGDGNSNGNGNGNGYVGGDVKDDPDDSSYVFVGGGVEVSSGEFDCKSDLVDGVDQVKKEEFGVENGGIHVDPLALESNVSEVEDVVKDDMSLENGSTVDRSVVVESNAIVQDVNGGVDKINKISGEDQAVVKSTEEEDDSNGIENVETKMDGVGSGFTFDVESTPNTIESSHVTVAESDSTVHPSDVTITQPLTTPDVINITDESLSTPNTTSSTNGVVMVNDGPECISNLTDEADDGSVKPAEDLESQVTADASEYTVSPTEEQEGQVTVDESVKPAEDLESEVTADASESTVRPTEEQEGQVTVDESGKPAEDLECQVSANGSESNASPTEEQEGQVTVNESGKPSEDLECQVSADRSESNASPTEDQEGQVTVNESGKPSEDLEYQVSVDRSESFVSPTEEQEGQQTVDESGKPSEALASQVTADEPESFESLKKEREGEVSVDGSDSIGNLVDNQECSASVESEPSGGHTEEVDGKSEEHQEVLVITSEINVEAEPNYVGGGLKIEHQSVTVSVPCQSDNNKTEVTDIGLSTESEENPASGLVLSENTDALANGQAEKFNGVSETEADISVPQMVNAKKEKSKEKQMEESSETPLEVTESVEIEAISEDKKEHVKEEDEIRESQIVAPDIVEDDLNLEDNTTESANDAEETNKESIIHVSTALHYEVSNSINKPQEGFQPDGSSENVETVDLVISEHNNRELLLVKDSDSLSTPDELTVVEHVKVEDEIRESHIGATDISEDDLNLENNTTESANEPEVTLETETNVESIIHENTASQYEVSDSIDKPQEGFQPEGSSGNIETVDLVISECNNSELLVKDNGSLSTTVEYVPHVVTNDRSSEGMDCGTGVENVDASDYEVKGAEVKDAPDESVPHLVIENMSAEGTDSGTGVENIDSPDAEEKENEVNNVPVGGHSTLSFSDTIVNSGAVIEFGSIGRHETTHNTHNEEAEDIDAIQSDEIPTSSVEGSVIDAIDVQNEVDEVLPYNFLIKIPRCEDENLRDQIRSAQLLVEEKTRVRDAIRVEIQQKRASLKAHNEAFNAAKTEETAARRLVRLKRQEIDAVQVVINRLKNAMSVEDIDGRILNMERMIQHETLLLKDEKQFIREIKQLKTLREQLASNMGSPEEIRQAIDQKDQNEERMKTLRKELESLKDKASKAEAVVRTAGKTYNEESRMERELQARFRAADDVRQNAYAQLNSLRKLSYDKNKNFRQFKEDLMAARDFASHGNKDALHRLCANQVETFMEQWNNNDEFRKEYVSRCNVNASRRQRTLDGGPLVPDDVAPVLPGNVNEKVDNSAVSVSIPGEVKSVSVVSSTEKKHADSSSNTSNRSIENVSGQKHQTLKTKGAAKPTSVKSDDVAVVTELAIDNKKEEENTPTKEEIELAKKAEELRKEEIAAKLKEQRRLEEKAKALEALERKKRNAEKAQIRAELRARKEAEQKEKEREKRLRKKEKKKTGGGDDGVNREEAVVASSESANEAATKDTEIVLKEKSKKKTAAAPPPHVIKQQQQLKPKPIPPPLVNRNRKRWQQWGKWALAVAAIFFLFMLGNTSYIRLKFNGLI
ncbi:hypothetical protein HanPI659440_Chr12g0458481 [Helianthus annuus]|nr:hypothetical protein HanPI659440_Chr12g0458481 [Helianthus annuus]